jgi:PKD repeat protein
VRLGVRKESSPGRGRSPRHRYALLAALAAAAAFVVFPGLSGATPSDLPDVTTGAATSLTNAGATLNGTVNPNDSDTTATYDYTFTWGTSSNNLTLGSDGGQISGSTSDQQVSVPAPGLDAGTTYFFQLCAQNDADSTDASCGLVQSFTTDDEPAVTTNAASGVGQTTATLNGSVDPNDPDDGGSFTFSWGTTSGGPYNTGSQSGSFGAGTSGAAVSLQITGLTGDTTYFFQLCATNDWGTVCGGEQSFTSDSPPPTVVTGAATGITTSGATLAGTVNPNGSTVTQVFFNYGTDTSYGSSAAASPSPGGGKTAKTVQASLSALASGTTFHYQLCATNGSGSKCGGDKTFATDQPPSAVLNADVTSGPTPLKVTFDGSDSTDPNPTGSISSWKLTFGDGSTAKTGSGPSVPSSIVHTYTTACSCTARLTVTDDDGGVDTMTLGINVTTNQPPIASLNPSTTSGTVPLAVTFDGSDSFDPDNIPLKSWSLDFGDGSTPASGGPGPVPDSIPYTYTAAGTYTAVLTVTDSSNATDTDSVKITVNPQPTLSIGDVSHNEGNSGTTNFVFPLTLSAPSSHDITVKYATADGTATAGSGDYNATSGTQKIPAGTSCPGDPSCQITVQVNGDTLYENNETFTVNLSSPSGATISDGTGTGTIINDDTAPLLEIASGAAPEGNTGSLVSGAQSWGSGGNLTLKDASGFPSSAGPHTFYTSTPGQQAVSQPYTYQGVSGNTLTGVSPTGSVSAGQWAFQPRTITLNVLLCDPQKTSGTDPDNCVATASGRDTKVNYSTSNGFSGDTHIPVVMGQDYVYSAGTLDIPVGAQSGQITVQNIPNTTPENPSNPTEDLLRWFFVNLASPSGATIREGLATAQIIEDDGVNPPIATTGAASGIGADHATAAASVNPDGVATSVYVQYGPTDSYGSQTAPQSLAGGVATQPLSFSLTGLSPGTTYHYQVVASHPDGITGYGKDATFTTHRLPIAVLKADVTSGSHPLEVTFDGSASSDPDASISSWKLAFGDGSSKSGTGVPGAITHTYASNCSCTASLTVTADDGAASKPAKVVIRVGNPRPPSLLSGVKVGPLWPTSATVSVHVDPNGASTQVWVEYGTDSSYGDKSITWTVPAGAAKTVPIALTGLTPNTTYDFRVVATHSDSGRATATGEFKTPKPKPMKVVVKKSTVRATSSGLVPLPFHCGGNVLHHCSGQIVLKLGKKRVGSKSFSVVPQHGKVVGIKLTGFARRRLLHGPLHLVLTLSMSTSPTNSTITTKRITVLPPL